MTYRKLAVGLIQSEFGGANLDIINALLHLDALLLLGLSSIGVDAADGVTRDAGALLLLLEVLVCDLLIVLVHDLRRDTFHTKDLNVQALASGDGVLDLGERLLVHLVHVDGQTCV